jgi:hypothetical protein
MRRLLLGVAVLALFGCDAAPPPVAENPATIAPESAAPADARGGLAVEVVEPAVAVVGSAPAAPARFGSGPGLVRAGVLTAGDIDDGLNFGSFSRYLARVRAETRWAMGNLANPILARLVGPDGQPAPRQRVTLRRAGAADPFWDGYSGVDGVITVFPALYGVGNPGTVEIRVFPPDQGDPVTATLSPGATRQPVTVPFAGLTPTFLDLVFVVDTTGSMGDELAWLTRDLNAIVRRAREGLPGLDVRYGLVVYRDDGDEYVVRNFGFTDQASTMRSNLRAQVATGGGDYPEAAADALASAAALDWRRGQGERLLFHIADAPPHDGDYRAYLAAAATAAQANVQIFGLGASGVGEESEYLMRQAAVMTGGRYLFLTDDSGVGLAHAEPTISCYQVTDLSGLLGRVIRSELTGRRVEPAAGDIVRSVGSYQNGVCRD